MIVVMFALPQESRDFRRELQHARIVGPEEIAGSIGQQRVLVTHTGIGWEAAEKSARSVLRNHAPAAVISAGFAGGLDPQLQVGDLLLATNFSSAEACARAHPLLPERSMPGVLTTQTAAIETADGKQRLAAETGAAAVDMETGAIFAACEVAGVPLLAVRGISDAAGDALPVPFDRWYDLRLQRPRPGGLVAYLLAHPQQITPFVRFIRQLALPRKALAAFLIRYLET